jgi:predicted RNase H-like HicB family nuclease
MEYSYTVILRKEPEGSYTVLVPALPGCLTFGRTISEALRMAEEAIGLHVACLLEQGLPVPVEGERIGLDTGGLEEGFLSRVTVRPDTQVATHA